MTPHESVTSPRGPFMLTRSGRRFYPLDPLPSDFHMFDIGQSLSKTCRYNGHAPEFYSVAEHCTILSQYFLDRGELENARWAWAHDGAETYIGDMIRPIKWMFPEFHAIEKKIEVVYFRDVLKLDGSPSKEVIDADTLICNDERYQLWKDVKLDGEYITTTLGHNMTPKLGITIQALDHKAAFEGFMNMYARLWLDY